MFWAAMTWYTCNAVNNSMKVIHIHMAFHEANLFTFTNVHVLYTQQKLIKEKNLKVNIWNFCTLVWNTWPNQASAYAGYGTPFATLGLIAQWLAVIAFAFAIAFEPSWGKIRMHQFFFSWTNLLEGLGEILLFYVLWTLEVKLTTYYFGGFDDRVIQLLMLCSLWVNNCVIWELTNLS